MKKLYFLAVLSALVLLYSGCVVENEEPPRPVELEISKQPTKVEYKKGETLDLSGLEVTLKKSDGTSEVLEKGKYAAVPSEGTVLAEPGKKTVTITAEGLSATFTITVTAPEEKPDVSAGELVISKKPAKVEYKKGETLDLSGLEVTLKKSDGISEVLEKGKYAAVPSEGTELTAPGEKTVTITAEGLSVTFTITVTAPEEKPDVSAGELVISEQPTKTVYKKGDKLDLSGLEVTLKRPDGTSEVLLTQYTTEPSEGTVLTEPGEKTVTITAEGLSATFTITVTAPEEKPDVSAVELVISEQPTKTVYKKGDELDLSGLEVTLKKSDGTSEVLEEGEYTAVPAEGTELTAPGEKTVTITAEGLSTTFTITVAAPERLEISKQPTKVGYEKGDKLDLSGLEITLHKTDGTSEVLEEGRYTAEPEEGTELTEPGEKTVRITAEGLTETFTICVAGLTFSTDNVKKNYTFYAPLDLSGLEVKLYHADGTLEEKYTASPEEGTYLENIGEQKVAVTVGGESREFSVSVSDEYVVVGDNGNHILMKVPVEVKEKAGRITVPESIVEIGGRDTYSSISGEMTEAALPVFDECGSNLKEIKLMGGIKRVCSQAFLGFSGEVKVAGENSHFFSCKTLQRVVIEDGVTKIGDSAFNSCENLTSIEIPSSVTEIGNSAFSSCENLTSIEIPSSVTKIGIWAFLGCSSLRSVGMQKGVTEIGSSAFGFCTALESVMIPDGVTVIEGHTFSGCTALKSVTIPDGVTVIYDNVFSGCTALESVTIPDGVTKIDGGVFRGCTALKSVKIPKSVEILGRNGNSYEVFGGCEKLTSVDYMGTEDQWNSIKVVYIVYPEKLCDIKSYYWAVGLQGKIIVCTDGEIQY